MIRCKATVPALVILAGLFANSTVAAHARDNLQYCNAVQNKVGFIRYPLGTIAAWSTASGEVADVMTRVPRVYPCLNSVVVKPAKEDWRASITGDPSVLTISYQSTKPSGATATSITVSPHVSVFKVTFPEGAEPKYLVFDFSRAGVDNWAALNRWTNRSLTRVDSQTIRATVGEPGQKSAWYVIKFSAPCLSSGTISGPDSITDGATNVTGTGVGMYARFEVPTVTVAIAESFTSMDKAADFLASEFTDFDSVRQRCRDAWDQVLGRVEIEGAENTKRTRKATRPSRKPTRRRRCSGCPPPALISNSLRKCSDWARLSMC
jgi:putative alpha-1,2-mannosidase